MQRPAVGRPRAETRPSFSPVALPTLHVNSVLGIFVCQGPAVTSVDGRDSDEVLFGED